MMQGFDRRLWVGLLKQFEISRQWVIDAIFPEFCLFCGAEGFALCSPCAAALPLVMLHGCPFCDRVSMFGRTCDVCKSKNPLAGVFSFGLYSDPRLRRIVIALKYHGKRDLGSILGRRTASFLLSVSPSQVEGPILSKDFIITAVPLHPSRLKQRGYNQSELLAHSIAETLGLSFVNLLERTRITNPQVEIHGVTARLENVRGAFTVKMPERSSDHEVGATSRTSSLAGTSVLLVDDVVTTGATLTACARALKKAGALSVYALTFVRG